MKLKEFKKLFQWKVADCVEYVDENGVEIEPTTEVQRRKMFNMEVNRYKTLIRDNLVVLKIFLK